MNTLSNFPNQMKDNINNQELLDNMRQIINKIKDQDQDQDLEKKNNILEQKYRTSFREATWHFYGCFLSLIWKMYFVLASTLLFCYGVDFYFFNRIVTVDDLIITFAPITSICLFITFISFFVIVDFY